MPARQSAVISKLKHTSVELVLNWREGTKHSCCTNLRQSPHRPDVPAQAGQFRCDQYGGNEF